MPTPPAPPTRPSYVLPEPVRIIVGSLLPHLPNLKPMEELNLINSVSHAYAVGRCEGASEIRRALGAD